LAEISTASTIGDALSVGKRQQAQGVMNLQKKDADAKVKLILITWDRLILFVGGRSAQ
jgi:hypothetical protein